MCVSSYVSISRDSSREQITYLGYGPKGRYLLEIRKDRWILDVNEEIYNEQNVAIGRQSSVIGRVDFPTLGCELERGATQLCTDLRLLHTLTETGIVRWVSGRLDEMNAATYGIGRGCVFV